MMYERYDFGMVSELCQSLGFATNELSADELAVELASGVWLVYINEEDEANCRIEFEGTDWHTHGGLGCVDQRGNAIEIDYLDIVSGLASGEVLVCEEWKNGRLADRFLVHRDYADELRFMQPGDELRYWSCSRKGQ